VLSPCQCVRGKEPDIPTVRWRCGSSCTEASGLTGLRCAFTVSSPSWSQQGAAQLEPVTEVSPGWRHVAAALLRNDVHPRPDIAEKKSKANATVRRDLVTEAGAEVLDTQMRGKRRLAYTIAEQPRRHLACSWNHSGDGQQVAALGGAMRLSEEM